ncbi:MAG TPA: AEC family transporter [Burkholderiaceae bacterium]
MSLLAILFPDFALIASGVLLRRFTGWGDSFWGGLEKLVYFMLFPALLFRTTARTAFAFDTTGPLLQVTLAALACGIALGWLAKWVLRPDRVLFASGVQTAFRFNTYICLALASRIGGDQGASAMALLVGFGVPLCNIFAVYALAHRAGGLLRELARNPLLLAATAGTLWNVAGLGLPEVADAVLARLASASLALGLLAVGAGLRLGGSGEAPALSIWFVAVKLVAMPALAFTFGHAMGLSPLHLQIAVLFCAVPTASSAYVLAARMGGNGPYVAMLVSVGIVASAITLPFWLSLVH